MTAEDARRRAITRLEAEHADCVQTEMRDVGAGGIWGWAARAYAAAINELEDHPPAAQETVDPYLARVSDLVLRRRGYGPDSDNDGYYEGAIDRAVRLINESGVGEAPASPSGAPVQQG